MMFFIFNILSILSILVIDVAEITLRNNLMIEENNELSELARNSYISSLSFSVFYRFYEMIDCSVISIFIESDFDLDLFYLFCFFYSTFSVNVDVANNSVNSSFSSACSLFWLKIVMTEEYLT